MIKQLEFEVDKGRKGVLRADREEKISDPFVRPDTDQEQRQKK